MKRMRRILTLSFAVFLASAVLLAAAALAGGTGNLRSEASVMIEPSSKNVLVVSGDASIAIKPDLATLSLGVRTQNVKSQPAQKENAAAMAAVVEAFKKAGVSADQIQTSSYDVYRTQDYRNGEPTPEYYVVSNRITVKTRKIDQVGALIDAASAAGANQFDGVAFSVENPDPVYNRALAEALKSAKAKADVLAAAAGVKIGTPLRIIEISNYHPPTIYRAEAKFESMMNSTPIEGGELVITAAVTVEYNY